MENKTGIELIAIERQEQIEKHGFSIGRDKEFYEKYELIQAALFCIDQAVPDEYNLKTYKTWPNDWDWAFRKKIELKDKIGQLKVAGAFIAAQIDALQESEKSLIKK